MHKLAAAKKDIAAAERTVAAARKAYEGAARVLPQDLLDRMREMVGEAAFDEMCEKQTLWVADKLDALQVAEAHLHEVEHAAEGIDASDMCSRCDGTGLYQGYTSHTDRHGRPICFYCSNGTVTHRH